MADDKKTLEISFKEDSQGQKSNKSPFADKPEVDPSWSKKVGYKTPAQEAAEQASQIIQEFEKVSSRRMTAAERRLQAAQNVKEYEEEREKWFPKPEGDDEGRIRTSRDPDDVGWGGYKTQTGGDQPPGIPPSPPPPPIQPPGELPEPPDDDPFGVFDTSNIDPAALQATIDALAADMQGLSAAGQAAAQAGLASARASTTAAGAAGAAATALGGGGAGGVGGGAAVAGGAAAGAGAAGGGMLFGGGLAGAATAAGLALLGCVVAGAAFNAAVNNMVEVVGQFSGAIQAASAQSRVQEIKDKIEMARQVGPDVAALERQRSEIASEFRAIYREGIEIVAPLLSAIAPLIELGLSILRKLMEAVNTVIDMIEYVVEEVFIPLLKVIPLFWPVMGVIKRFEKWMKSNNTQPGVTDLNAFYDLFDPMDIGVRNVDFDNDGRQDLGDPNNI